MILFIFKILSNLKHEKKMKKKNNSNSFSTPILTIFGWQLADSKILQFFRINGPG